MSKTKVHASFMGACWSIDRKDFLDWMKKQIEQHNREAQLSDCFVFDMDGWKELAVKNMSGTRFFKPDHIDVETAREIVERFKGVNAREINLADYISSGVSRSYTPTRQSE